jgi:hypothetical protein
MQPKGYSAEMPSRSAGSILVAAFFFLFGLALLGGFFLQDIPLLASGVRTIAEVTHVDHQSRRRSYVTLAFKLEDGTPARARVHQSSAAASYVVGETARIAYRRADPQSAEILTFAQIGTSMIMKLLFGGTAIAMAFLNARSPGGKRT